MLIPAFRNTGMEPSGWVCRWAGLIRKGGRVLDVACGAGRHALYLAGQGFEVDAVDIDLSACMALASLPNIHLRQFDLEKGAWPYSKGMFQGVVVTHYLHRPLFPHLIESIAPGGVFIYETFALGNERYGKPSNPGFLLRPNELLEMARGRLRVIAYEDLLIEAPRLARMQRICAEC